MSYDFDRIGNPIGKLANAQERLAKAELADKIAALRDRQKEIRSD